MESIGQVLVVDDDSSLVESIVAALGPRYTVRSALNGSEAITAICEIQFDLVLLDHRLPDLLGTDLLRLIKRFFPSTTVVLVTGQGSETVAAEALRSGARDYLQKPFSLQDLLACVESVFSVRRNGVERRRESYSEAQTIGPIAPGLDADTDRSRAILRAIEHLKANLRSPLPLDEVARLAGMSKFHFCRQFREIMGTSFRTFLVKERIARAKELLRDPTQPIGNVASAVGFRDATHFGRAFRKFEHVLPSEYRRQATGNHH